MLIELGASATIHELNEPVAVKLQLSEAVLELPHLDGPTSEFAYRCGWTRTHLRWIRGVHNPARGVWTMSGSGRQIQSAHDVYDLLRQSQKEARISVNTNQDIQENQTEESNETELEKTWKERLHKILKAMDPHGV